MKNQTDFSSLNFNLCNTLVNDKILAQLVAFDSISCNLSLYLLLIDKCPSLNLDCEQAERATQGGQAVSTLF